MNDQFFFFFPIKEDFLKKIGTKDQLLLDKFPWFSNWAAQVLPSSNGFPNKPKDCWQKYQEIVNKNSFL